MISDKVYKLCTSQETVSSLLTKDPTMAPGDAWKQLYGGDAAGEKESKDEARRIRDTTTPEDLQRALECGNWGPTQPSELFLTVNGVSSSTGKELPLIFGSYIMMRCVLWITV